MTDRTVERDADVLLPEDVYRRALAVGRAAAGRSGPNPPVGCVIVRDGEVVSDGATREVGGPHAEVIALRAAGDAAHGAVAVVTLEPCTHVGRTPACTDALLRAGVAEVHVLQADPDPVAAGGMQRLRAGGITVVDVAAARPDLGAAAAHDLRGFLARVRVGRPHVTLKLAQTVDGRTTPEPGAYLTGLAARRHVHALRAETDAVLVGGATVRIDDPALDVRHVHADRQPRAVVASASGDLPEDARVLREGAIVMVGAAVPAPTRAAWAARGVRVLELPAVAGGLHLMDGMRSLLEERVLTVLAEPGPRLAGALLAAGVVDAVELHVAGGAHGGPIVPAVTALAPLVAEEVRAHGTITEDGDLLLRADLAVPVPAAGPLAEVA